MKKTKKGVAFSTVYEISTIQVQVQHKSTMTDLRAVSRVLCITYLGPPSPVPSRLTPDMSHSPEVYLTMQAMKQTGAGGGGEGGAWGEGRGGT